MSQKKLVTGVNAAVPTPRYANGALDLGALEQTLEFLMGKGIHGFAINGATGEFCLTTPAESKTLAKHTADVLRGRATFVFGVGAAGSAGCIESGFAALEAGAAGLLLPMPYFFRYDQIDLAAFCRTVAHRLSAPILLYNLPQFSSGLEPATAQELIEQVPDIAGIKDSSGALDILRALSPSSCRIVGSDNALVAALREQVCDGVISGVAGAMPELISSVYNGIAGSDRLLDEFVQAISPFPVPWALKWIAEARGIAPAVFSQPIAPQRAEQGAALRRWFHTWSEVALPAISRPAAAY